jgi:hypothetical protein
MPIKGMIKIIRSNSDFMTHQFSLGILPIILSPGAAKRSAKGLTSTKVMHLVHPKPFFKPFCTVDDIVSTS